MEHRPETLFFDLFGTVFDWRTSVIEALESTFANKVKSQNSNSISSQVVKAIEEDAKFWPNFAQDWNTVADRMILKIIPEDIDSSRKKYAASSKLNKFLTSDFHYYNSLNELLVKHSLGELYSQKEKLALSRVWHDLKPWDDSVAGLAALSKLATTVSLSNGSIQTLNHLCKNSGAKFDVLLSGELFQSYKPDPKVYIGGCELLGYGVDVPADEGQGTVKFTEEEKRTERGKCALVAAHLYDLKGARDCGMATIYVERPGEDQEEATNKAKEEGWVDVWIKGGQQGLLDVAKALEKIGEPEGYPDENSLSWILNQDKE